MLAPTYKSKTEDFRKTFKDIPPDERLIVGMLKYIFHYLHMSVKSL